MSRETPERAPREKDSQEKKTWRRGKIKDLFGATESRSEKEDSERRHQKNGQLLAARPSPRMAQPLPERDCRCLERKPHARLRSLSSRPSSLSD